MAMGGGSETHMSNASEDTLNAPTLCPPRSDKRGLKKANISFSNLYNFILIIQRISDEYYTLCLHATRETLASSKSIYR